jgi:hypothetical protein
MFDIIDPRFSKYWQTPIYTFLDGTIQSGVFLINVLNNPTSITDFLDDDENAIEMFEKHKKILDEEFD